MARFSFLLAALLFSSLALPAPAEYTATYTVLRNDSEMASVTIRLSQLEDVWTLHGHVHDTRGLAKVLRIKGTQTSTLLWQDGRLIPAHYSFAFSLIGYKNNWQAEFDWPGQQVLIEKGKKSTSLKVSQAVSDPFSLSLMQQSALRNKQQQMQLSIVDEDEIKHHDYRQDGEEMLNTSLGCIKTVRLKRIRENSKRQSLGWYASDHDFIPVRMLHKKPKGNSLELRITALTVNGISIKPDYSATSVRKPSACISLPINLPSVAYTRR